jgi:hypothetical protein
MPVKEVPKVMQRWFLLTSKKCWWEGQPRNMWGHRNILLTEKVGLLHVPWPSETIVFDICKAQECETSQPYKTWPTLLHLLCHWVLNLVRHTSALMNGNEFLGTPASLAHFPSWVRPGRRSSCSSGWWETTEAHRDSLHLCLYYFIINLTCIYHITLKKLKSEREW